MARIWRTGFSDPWLQMASWEHPNYETKQSQNFPAERFLDDPLPSLTNARSLPIEELPIVATNNYQLR